MEHGHVSPNLEAEFSENYGVEGSSQGVDTSTAESKKSLTIQLEVNESIETTKLKNKNDNVETLKFGDHDETIEIVIQDNESEKNQYPCKFCSQVFNKYQALGGHMNGHSKDQRNMDKFGKFATWIHATYPPPLNTTLTSEAKQQGTPTNGAAYNSYNHLVEVGDMYSQPSGQWTNQQLTQQIQLSQGLQIQQQQLQNYQASQRSQIYQTTQQFQNYQTLQGLQKYQALQGSQNYQIPQGSQSYQTPQGSQNYQALQEPQYYQIPQGSQNYQIPQVSQSYQTPQGSQNYQVLQEPQYYQIPQGSQNYQIPQGSQSYQAPQGSQNYQAPQGSQSYQTPQGSQNYQAPQGSQSYQTPQGSQNYQAPQGSQNYQAPQRSQSNQNPQGLQQQILADANNQQKFNRNSKTSTKPTSFAKVPSNEQKNNLSNSQGQKEAQGQRYMPNVRNLRNGDRLTTGPFINEQMNKAYYGHPNVLKRNNQMIRTLHNYNDVAQSKPANSPNTSGSINQSKDDLKIEQ